MRVHDTVLSVHKPPLQQFALRNWRKGAAVDGARLQVFRSAIASTKS